MDPRFFSRKSACVAAVGADFKRTNTSFLVKVNFHYLPSIVMLSAILT